MLNEEWNNVMLAKNSDYYNFNEKVWQYVNLYVTFPKPRGYGGAPIINECTSHILDAFDIYAHWDHYDEIARILEKLYECKDHLKGPDIVMWLIHAISAISMKNSYQCGNFFLKYTDIFRKIIQCDKQDWGLRNIAERLDYSGNEKAVVAFQSMCASMGKKVPDADSADEDNGDVKSILATLRQEKDTPSGIVYSANDGIAVNDENINDIFSGVSEFLENQDKESYFSSSRNRKKFISAAKKFSSLRWTGNSIPIVEFWGCMPVYGDMDGEQFAYYLYWRTAALNGNFMDCPLSYFFLYVYELLAEIHSDNPDDNFGMLRTAYEKYGAIHSKISQYLPKWIFDYTVLNGLYDRNEKYLQSIDPVKSLEGREKLQKIFNEDFEGCFDTVISSSTYKMNKKSSFYKHPEYAAIVDSVFDKCIEAVNKCMKEHGLVLTEFLVGHRTSREMAFFDRTPVAITSPWKCGTQHDVTFGGIYYRYDPEVKGFFDDCAVDITGNITGGQDKTGIYTLHNGDFIAYIVKCIEQSCRKAAGYKYSLRPSYTFHYGTERLNKLAESQEIQEVTDDVVRNYIQRTELSENL